MFALAWCCRNDQQCCTGSGGGCMPNGAHDCGGRGYCDNGLLCCGLSSGTCYPPKAGKCCASPRGIWCPFDSVCKYPPTGAYCSANSTTSTSSTATSDVTVGFSQSTSELKPCFNINAQRLPDQVWPVPNQFLCLCPLLTLRQRNPARTLHQHTRQRALLVLYQQWF